MLIERKHTADLIPADYNPRKDLKPGDPAGIVAYFVIAILLFTLGMKG